MVKIMVKIIICGPFSTGDTALHTAVEHNYLGIMKMLLQHNADVSAVSEHNLTPVFIAAQFGKAECLQELLTEARIQGKIITDSCITSKVIKKFCAQLN